MKFLLENHSGDVNIDSGAAGFFIHSAPESIFTSRRNPYSHRSGTIIHMPRNPQYSGKKSEIDHIIATDHCILSEVRVKTHAASDHAALACRVELQVA